MKKIKEFISCSRPHSFPAALAPILVGSSFALSYVDKFNWLNFFVFLLACLFIQAATNLFNEYYDFKRGLDKIDSEGISGSIVKGKLTSKEVFNGAIFLYIISLILGVYLSFVTSYYLFLVGLICMLFGYLYTGGKYPIAYSPFGELVSGFFMGTVIISIAFYLQTGYINVETIIVSLPIFILIAMILLANNIRDLENDKVSGRKTYAIVVGKKNAVKTMLISFGVVYILNILFFVVSIGSIYNFLVFVTIPIAKRIIVGFSNNNDKKTMAPFMVLTAKLTIIIGFITAFANFLKVFFSF